MPVPNNVAVTSKRQDLGHVGTMADTFIANADADDLRALVRNMLAIGTPQFIDIFHSDARSRVHQAHLRDTLSMLELFRRSTPDGQLVVGGDLNVTLVRARTLYGVGLGFCSLEVLTRVVRATIGGRWDVEGDVAGRLAEIDADISQALQSCKEELASSRVNEISKARETVEELRVVLKTSLVDVEAWGGEFPFERAVQKVTWGFSVRA